MATDPAPVTDPAPDVVADVDGQGAPPAALQLLDLEAAPPGTYGELEPAHPPLIDAQGRVRLSFSRIESYANCPRKFRYSYVDKLPGRPGPHLSFGTSIHNALEAFYDQKLPDCPSVEELLGFLYDRWEHSGFADLPRDEQIGFYRHAQQVLRRYHQRVADRYRLPVATEAWFELPIEYQATVVGSIDRVDVDDEGRFHVVDYKTNRKVKDRARVASSLQLSLYALACRHLYGALPATVSLDFVVAGVEVTATLEELDLDAARQAVLDTAAAVRAEAYEPTPNPLCDWCDFQALCPAWPTGAGVEALGPAVAELRSRRRAVAREVQDLRALEAGVDRIAAELAAAEAEAAVGADTRPAEPVAGDADAGVVDGAADHASAAHG
jgi:RecB family exonuclease